MTGSAGSPIPSRSRPHVATDRRRHARPRVRKRESLRFLTEVGNTLAASLDYQATPQKVAELMVPRLACYCELDLVEEGRVQRMGMAHGDPAQREALSRRVLFPAQVGATGPLAEVLDSGEPLLLTSKCDDPPGTAKWEQERQDLLRLTRATSLLLIPLIARGRALGVLLLASTRTDRSYGPQDLVLAGELARIAALAIDNARLY